MNCKAFISNVFAICSSDKGARADFRRADNPTYEWKIWPEIFKAMGCSLEPESERKACALVAAAAAKSGMTADGSVSLGGAFKLLDGGKSGDSFPPRLTRLLAAESRNDLIETLRPTLTFMSSSGIKLDYAVLLEDILHFNGSGMDKVKAKWASDYLRAAKTEE